MELLEGIFIGAVGVGVIWFGSLAVKNGASWAIAKLKAWWNAAKNDLAAVKADLAKLDTRVSSLESKAAPAVAPPAAPAA